MQDHTIQYTECLSEKPFSLELRHFLETTLPDKADPKTTRFLVVVVLYGIELQMSETIERLRALPERATRLVRTLIWNNGPRPLASKKNAPPGSILVNAVGNTPLGTVYNHALSFNDLFDVFVIFDQDTRFEPAFFEAIEEAMHSGLATLAVPTSKSGDLIVSPVLRSYRSSDDLKPGLFDGSMYTAIGSGMVIPSSLALECQFTSELQFYGVDHNFFKSVAKRLPIMLLPSIQVHSVSTRETPLFESDFKTRSLIHSIYFNNINEIGAIRAFLITSKIIFREGLRGKSVIGIFKYMAHLIRIVVQVGSRTKRL